MTREEAINLVKQVLPCLNIDEKIREGFETLIPELKESEDERIRKFICSIIDNLEPKDFVGVKKMNVLAWLEKRSISTPADEEKNDMKDFIEIPFGAKDSELKGWEYTIPEGFTAEIKDGKVIVREKESEDERIRKELINFILYKAKGVSEEQEHSWVAYLEKQKERGPLTKEEEYILHHIIEHLEDETCPSEWISLLHDIYCLPYEKQKEQKLVKCELEDAFKYYTDAGITVSCGDIVVKPKEQKPTNSEKPKEWSEEDEKDVAHIIRILDDCYAYGRHDLSKTDHENLVNKLMDLRPQPREEIYQSAKHDLAIRFMNYLDENRPDGKMGLSNGECEDIDKAFKENDWAKILRYAEKYGK